MQYCAPGYSSGRYPMEGSSAGLYLIKREGFGGLEYRGFKDNGEIAFHITEGQFFLRAAGKCIRVLRFLFEESNNDSLYSDIKSDLEWLRLYIWTSYQYANDEHRLFWSAEHYGFCTIRHWYVMASIMELANALLVKPKREYLFTALGELKREFEEINDV